MDVSGWLRQCSSRVQEDPLSGLEFAARGIYHKTLQQGSRFRTGTPIYEVDWDLLIVLDACRYDLFTEVADDYSFINGVNEFVSVDSMTQAWMGKNFSESYLSNMASTAYVCGNPFSHSELSESNFSELDELWRYAWDEDTGTLPPRPVTDRAITTARATSCDRYVVHYMQPHCPFIPDPEMSAPKDVEHFGGQPGRDIWERLRAGEYPKSRVWEGYRKNLELVLDDVQLLLENVDAEQAVITSDHGNALGEWGVYGHPPHQPLSCLRNVPWAPVEATDSGSHEPATIRSETSGSDVDRRLEALGYVDG